MFQREPSQSQDGVDPITELLSQLSGQLCVYMCVCVMQGMIDVGKQSRECLIYTHHTFNVLCLINVHIHVHIHACVYIDVCMCCVSEVSLVVCVLILCIQVLEVVVGEEGVGEGEG